MGGHRNNNSPDILAGINLASSCYGSALPLCYGTTRVPGNMVDYDDFTTIANSQPTGKGGTSGGSVVNYTYTANAIVALCEGPITGINRVWLDQSINTATFFNLSVFLGTRPQSPWGTWTTYHPNKALGYAGMAMACGNFNLGSSGQMPNNSFEVVAFLATEPDSGSYISLGTGDGTTKNFMLLDNSGNPISDTTTPPWSSYSNPVYYVNGVIQSGTYTIQKLTGNDYFLCFATAPAVGALITWSTTLVMMDAKPSAILVDFLTDPTHGAGWAAGNISDLVTGNASWQTYCTAMGFAVSPCWDTQQPAATMIRDLLDATNSEAVWTASLTGMTLNVVPYGDVAVAANGVTYIPNPAPLYSLTYDDFRGVVDAQGHPTGNDPVTATRTSTQDTYNSIPVEFWDRQNAYNTSSVTDSDPEDVAQRGVWIGSGLTMHMITRRAQAMAISRIAAQKSIYVRTTYTFQLGWKYLLLEPMDLVAITDTKLGLSGLIVRIVSIDYPEESSEEDGMTVTAEQWPFGTGTPVLYAGQNAASSTLNSLAAPGNTNTPVIFDVPALYRLNSSDTEIMVAASGGAQWGGCEVWVSYDGSTYAYAGSISKNCNYGTLTATLPTSSVADDVTNTLSVSLAVSGGTLQTVDAPTAAAYLNEAWVDGEIISPQTATLTGANAYNLTTLWRGGNGSPISSHASGSNFVHLDEAPLRIVIPPAMVGSPVYVKCPAVNLCGANLQSLAACSAYTYNPAGAAFPQPINVAFTITSTTTSPTYNTPPGQMGRIVSSA